MEFWKNVSHLEMGVIELSSHVKNAKAFYHYVFLKISMLKSFSFIIVLLLKKSFFFMRKKIRILFLVCLFYSLVYCNALKFKIA